MKKQILLIICLAGLFIVGLSAKENSVLALEEKQNLIDMLRTADFDSTDVCFFKDWDPTTKFKLNCQVEALNNPWKFIDWLGEAEQICSDRLAYSLDSKARETDFDPVFMRSLTSYLDLSTPAADSLGKVLSGKLTSVKIRRPQACFAYWEDCLDALAPKVKTAFGALSSAQLDSLSCWMYQAWEESEDSTAYNRFLRKEGLDKYAGLSTTRAAELLSLIRFDVLAEANLEWQQYVWQLQRSLEKVNFGNKKPVYHQSKWGTMIIGTKGDDHYVNSERLRKNPVCLILDPGGNDTYDCDLFAAQRHPFYLLIDFNGNDVYRNSEVAKGMSVSSGFGTVIDYAGDDIYKYSDFAMSALLGFNSVIDCAGDDYYSTGLFSQAAAMFGISVLQDNEGNDTYTATEFAQGLGGCKGIGLLLDGKGNDVYYCGGKYLHTPLAPFDYRSMAQGFGFGFRSDFAGGIGILYDGEGNDRYSGGVYAQGVAYWYAIGALFDEGGNDYYDAVYYPQGSGIHLANGALIDCSGEDHYYSKHGPGQGNGHDWSVGVFIDQEGNDEYSVEGGNGLALTNSVGIFVDGAGDDKYEYKSSDNYGYANWARETGGIGLFLDAGGKDSYADSLQANDKTWHNGTYGIGRDIKINVPAQTKVEELAEKSVADVDSLASIAVLFDIASEWEVGSAVQRVKLARQHLLKRENEAVPYAVNQKLGTQSGLEYRALEELTKGSALMRASLYSALHDTDSLKVKNAIALIAEQGDSLVVDSIAVFLNQNKYIPACLSALGCVKTEKALLLVKPWLNHPTEKYRYLAARSLKSMNTPEALAELRKLNNDSSFLIKAMVRQLPPTEKSSASQRSQ